MSEEESTRNTLNGLDYISPLTPHLDTLVDTFVLNEKSPK